MKQFSEMQENIAEHAIAETIFLSGNAATGKTTAALAYLKTLRATGVSGNSIMILVPQRSLGIVYQDFLAKLGDFNGGIVQINTQSGLAQRMIRLFWPIIAYQTPFANPRLSPLFLNLETSQYYLDKICQPFFEKGYFESVHLEPPRILTQILDNLNKSALVGFPYQEISERLKSAWNLAPGHMHAYDEAQEVADEFRHFCYQHNLLDFSLQIEILQKYLWPSLLCKQHLQNQFRYIIYDNCEEDTASIHDIMLEWLPKTSGGLVIFDEDAGFRTFLGADPISAQRLKSVCNFVHTLSEPFLPRENMETVSNVLNAALSGERINHISGTFKHSFSHQYDDFYPKMIESVAEKVNELVSNGIKPAEIAILAPYVSDALRFQIQQQLSKHGIELAFHRPSRSLREEPVTHVLLTWAKIAHPEWGLIPTHFDLRQALTYTLQGLDPIRADLLTRVVFQSKKEFWLNKIFSVRMEVQERISHYISEKYQELLEWLITYRENPVDLDIFLARFFGEILTQPGFAFKDNFHAAEVTSKLIDSIQNFRQGWLQRNPLQIINISQEYITTLEAGVIAALYLQSWDKPPENAVYLSPAYTFLMQNRTVQYQFWIDIGSLGWWQRLLQPLTQPYVLSRNWLPGQKWTDFNEYETNQANLRRLCAGLIKRCESGLFLHYSGYNESGGEDRGPLLKAVQKILRFTFTDQEIKDV
ncbi:MAG: hypothetical protein BGO78_16430 [Chloroflexi bacterium 44-23]|nr:MAG: hypothetical protein BGO78_16430 [Chloroflexi bacterium 44-23]